MGLGIVPSILLYIIFSLWFTYSCILSDAPSPMAMLFTHKVPRVLISFVEKIFGTKGVKIVRKISEKALLIIYLVIVLGCWSVMFTYGYDFMTRSEHVSSNHKISGYVVFMACMWSWRKANTTSPGYIVEGNIPRFDNYPYDDLLYANQKCSSLGFRKLARSKYDRFTNSHVARFDHFCGWIDNTVGEENYRVFLLFLLIHVLMCAYGTFVTYHLFQGEIADKNLVNAIFYNAETGKEVKADYIVIAHYLFMKHFQVAAVSILMAGMSAVLGLFLCFHLYIAANGMTTNEYYKWRQVKKWHKKEKSKYASAVAEGLVKKFAASAKRSSGMGELPDVDVGCVGPTGAVTGQSGAEELDNNRPTNTREDEQADGIIDPGPFPKNIYNLGPVENFKEIVFPRSLRRSKLAPSGDGGNSSSKAKAM
jgi:hypothetical protein